MIKKLILKIVFNKELEAINKEKNRAIKKNNAGIHIGINAVLRILKLF